jgi:hypothetical protein
MAVASNKQLNVEPSALSASAANILNCAISSLSGPVGYTQTQPYLIVTHIRLVNKTGSPQTASLYKGATAGSAAGTEFAFNAVSIPANSYVDWYGKHRFDSADFLSGLAGNATAVTINIDAEIGLA